MAEARQMTRARAERAISGGADPTPFLGHGNYHVRRKAWVKLGRPMPIDKAERAALATSLKVTLDDATEAA